MSYTRTARPGGAMVVYIEGDGSAWDSHSRLSADPTPHDTLVIDLAAKDPSPNVVYLARPGQYVCAGASRCDSAYWSSRRFSEEVVAAMDSAIDTLKRASNATGLSLVGYSGGGAIAVLVAARRDDVTALRTIAGNLDHEAVNAFNEVSPLKGSLNPIDVAPALARIPQRHFAGSDDDVVPPFVARSFVREMGDANDERVTVVRGATHTKGWRERWEELLALPLN